MTMDIYGYAGFPYNQSDELAKQMYAHQALASSIPYNNRALAEPHTMPAPTGTPWNVQGLPWGMPSPPQLVQFTGQPQLMEPKISPVIHCKRKSLDVEPVIPAKQLITEEKMAAHLNSLHISSEYTTHALATPQDVMDIGMEPVSEKLKGHTIVLSEELKKLQEEPLLPAALIDRLEKPHMSLVVWKPRESILANIQEEKKEDEKHPQKRNGLLVTPNHQSDDVEM
ncbi:unnamed protein product [Spodoptera littoralis]|uniref:Uncharacterized protein n=2 Tax=Spodoptera TaxID=7106 RepID=A0A9P0I4F2_SPOLI|nr:uncharacterized protein LOC111360089 [Spodoptera litura]CAB3511532.1 unnamed protein product [Spodoptera littoralis]CAH1641192.1 unnamed protein product [Spodoptera littoralis]